MLAWFKTKTEKEVFAEYCANLYVALVEEGGPSSGSPSHIDANALRIRLTDLDRFSRKRRLTLEAFLFVGTQIAITQWSAANQDRAARFAPLAIEMGRLIEAKWAERGILLDPSLDVGQKCFDELEIFLARPSEWGLDWLKEFYPNGSGADENYAAWADQNLKEFRTIVSVVTGNLDDFAR